MVRLCTCTFFEKLVFGLFWIWDITLTIIAINVLDDESPPPFTYICIMEYPDLYYIVRPQGCGCTSRCFAFAQCACASLNRSSFPFNPTNSILKAKPIVNECGLYFKCHQSCKNYPRWSSLPFEGFQNQSKGWVLRSSD